jgi:lactoylglutathione lyase
MIDSLFPIIETADIARAVRFWRDLMGASVALEWPGPDGQLVYVGLDVGRSHLGIGLAAGSADHPHSATSLWVYTDDCDAVVQRLRDAGVPITAEPAEQPWGERVARALDPDGTEIIIGQRRAAGGA